MGERSGPLRPGEVPFRQAMGRRRPGQAEAGQATGRVGAATRQPGQVPRNLGNLQGALEATAMRRAGGLAVGQPFPPFGVGLRRRGPSSDARWRPPNRVRKANRRCSTRQDCPPEADGDRRASGEGATKPPASHGWLACNRQDATADPRSAWPRRQASDLPGRSMEAISSAKRRPQDSQEGRGADDQEDGPPPQGGREPAGEHRRASGPGMARNASAGGHRC